MALHDEILTAVDDEKKRRANPPFRLHGGVRGAHPLRGGIETPQADLDADDRRFGPGARFTQGPDGRDTMGVVDEHGMHPDFGGKPHVDTEPYLRRQEGEGVQLALGTEGAFKPTDSLQHFVRLKHPHLAQNYEFIKTGDDHSGHAIEVIHREGAPVHTLPPSFRPEQSVGYLRWNGTREVKPGGFHESGLAPGEIEGVSVHPAHRGMGLSTAMWDYAHAHNALHGSQAPVHSADRSTAGNHWAHFVGGAAMARTEGHGQPEYFTSDWRNR